MRVHAHTPVYAGMENAEETRETWGAWGGQEGAEGDVVYLPGRAGMQNPVGLWSWGL